MALTLDEAYAHPSLLKTLVETRRRLHRQPELGHEEWQTAEFVEGHLRTLGGLDVFRPAPTSVAALFGTGDEDLLVFRADLDALPVQEATGMDYASQRAGFMHGCGHDGHTAAVLTTAHVLLERLDQVRRPVLLLFQQAEERHPSGAPLVLRGLTERFGHRFRRAEVFGFHLWPHLPQGTIGVRPGPLMGSVAGVTVNLRSRRPATDSSDEVSRGDALRAAVRIHQDLGGLLHGRGLAADIPASLCIGCLQAGEAPQEPAAEATLRGTLRAVSAEAEAAAEQTIRDVVQQVAERESIEADIKVESGIRPVLRNDVNSVVAVQRACAVAGLPCIEYPDRPLGVSEDFGWYLTIARGTYFLVGCGTDRACHGLHSPQFDFDEEALLAPLTVLVSLACS